MSDEMVEFGAEASIGPGKSRLFKQDMRSRPFPVMRAQGGEMERLSPILGATDWMGDWPGQIASNINDGNSETYLWSDPGRSIAFPAIRFMSPTTVAGVRVEWRRRPNNMSCTIQACDSPKDLFLGVGWRYVHEVKAAQSSVIPIASDTAKMWRLVLGNSDSRVEMSEMQLFGPSTSGRRQAAAIGRDIEMYDGPNGGTIVENLHTDKPIAITLEYR